MRVLMSALQTASINTGSNIGNLLFLFLGVCVVFMIVFFIMRAMAMPPMAFTILYVIMGILLLICAIEFFFSGGSGTSVLR